MAVIVTKQPFNVRSKLSELDRPVGSHGGQLLKSNTAEESFATIQAGRRNIMHNGAMQVAQRLQNGGQAGSSVASITNNAYHTVDRWKWQQNGATVTLSQDTDVPEGQGFRYSSKMQVTTAVSSIAAGNVLMWVHNIEGQNLVQLAYGTPGAKTMTLSFWVRSSITGQFTTTFRHDSKIISKRHTVNHPDVWEKKTWTIPGDYDDVIGTLSKASGMSFNLYISAGSNTIAGSPVNNWGSFHSAHMGYGTNMNHIQNVNSTFYITGMQLEVGSQPTPFEHIPYAEELAICQRYYVRYRRRPDVDCTNFITTLIGGGGDDLWGVVNLPVPLRASPTLDYSHADHFEITNIFADNAVVGGSFSTAYAMEDGDNHVGIRAIVSPNPSVSNGSGRTLRFKNNLDGWLEYSADL